jgi:hypothetical protein
VVTIDILALGLFKYYISKSFKEIEKTKIVSTTKLK